MALAARQRTRALGRVLDDSHRINEIPIESAIPMRVLGRTGLKVSEVGFGAWAIGGTSYGPVERSESLAALARAEELGCNLVDTAGVYGNSEEIIGKFLLGRREKWIVATKYSGQPPSIQAELEAQLRRLRTDYVDLYQLHWVPPRDDKLYDSLQSLKASGKIRAIGVSLAGARSLSYVLERGDIDVIQIPFSLLDPYPFLDMYQRIVDLNMGVIIRSSLKEGFLTGKFTRTARFMDATDIRSKLSASEIERLVDSVERFRFLASRTRTLATAAISYPLSLPGVSAVILGTKSPRQALENFAPDVTRRLNRDTLERILETQRELGVFEYRQWAKDSIGDAIGWTP